MHVTPMGIVPMDCKKKNSMPKQGDLASVFRLGLIWVPQKVYKLHRVY